MSAFFSRLCAAQMGEMKMTRLLSNEIQTRQRRTRERERYDNDCDYAINAHNTTSNYGDMASEAQSRGARESSAK